MTRLIRVSCCFCLAVKKVPFIYFIVANIKTVLELNKIVLVHHRGYYINVSFVNNKVLICCRVQRKLVFIM